MSATHFIEPLDVLFLRGNKLFGEAGSFGESLVPPWPSVAAGAYRSALLVSRGIDLARYARGEIDDPEIGTPGNPGDFTVAAFHLARRLADGRVEPLFAVPADVVVAKEKDERLVVRRMVATELSSAISNSYRLPCLPVLPEPQRGKPEAGYWLTEAGWRAYLRGQTPTRDQLIHTSELWVLDTRVGVGLDYAQRRAADGRLFTVQAVAMAKQDDGLTFDAGFLVRVAGATLPEQMTLRIGGDGRAAVSKETPVDWPEPSYDDIADARRCRLVLTSPGIFDTPVSDKDEAGARAGWLPTGVTEAGERDYRFALHGVKGRLIAAAVSRAEVVSGWDLAAWSQRKGGPKPAQRVAPTGSVYWLEDLEATPDALRKLAENGLWTEEEYPGSTRRAEGFNRITFAAY